MRERYTHWLYAALILFFYFFNLHKDYYMGKWWLLVLTVTAMLCYLVHKRTSIWIGLLSFYLLSSSILVGLAKIGPYRYAKNSILYEPLKAWVYGVCLLLILLYVNPRNLKKAIAYIMPINILWCGSVLWYTKIFLPLQNPMGIHAGFDYNISVNATLMALMLPFNMNIFTALATLFVVISCKTSMGIVATIAAIAVYFFAKSKNKIPIALISAILIGISLVLIPEYDPKFFIPSCRLATWKAIVALVAREGRELFGFGMGTFSHIMPAVKILIPKITPENQVMLWAHNDYLQYYFEAGLVGIVLAVPVLIETVYKSWKRPICLSFVAAYLVSCVGNFPSHLASSSLLCIVMISLIYRKEDFNEEV